MLFLIERQRALQDFYCPCIRAGAVASDAERVEDVAVLWCEFGGFFRFDKSVSVGLRLFAGGADDFPAYLVQCVCVGGLFTVGLRFESGALGRSGLRDGIVVRLW